MKHMALAFILFLASLPALAGTCTTVNGSIQIIYTNQAGTCTYAPYAAISDATAATFITWCKAHYISTPAAATSLGCFNTWANDGFNQTINNMQRDAQSTATAAAAAAVAPPAITPAQ